MTSSPPAPSPDLAAPPVDASVMSDLIASPPDLAMMSDMIAPPPVDLAMMFDLIAPPPVDLAMHAPDLYVGKPPDMAPPPPDLYVGSSPDLHTPPPPPDLYMAPPPDLYMAPPPDLAHVAPPGPAPGTMTLLSSAAGIDDALIDGSPDEAGNLWAVSQAALYIMRPKDGFFRKYTNADGLDIALWVTAVQGAGFDEGFVGLQGYDDSDPLNAPDATRTAGKIDHVRLNGDGSISVNHLGNIHNYPFGQEYWETHSARRLLYVHDGGNAGHVFMGGNHGITDILASNDSYGDHTHVEATWPDGSLMLGDWYGLAVDPTTQGLWECGIVACGLLAYNNDAVAWVDGHYKWAFTVWLPSHDLAIAAHYYEYNIAVAPLSDGTVYFMSRTNGVAKWDQATANYQAITPITVPGLGGPVDMVVDNGSILYLADSDHVIRWDPKTNSASDIKVPVGGIHRLEIDTHSKQHALYVSTNAGLAVYQIP